MSYIFFYLRLTFTLHDESQNVTSNLTSLRNLSEKTAILLYSFET